MICAASNELSEVTDLLMDYLYEQAGLGPNYFSTEISPLYARSSKFAKQGGDSVVRDSFAPRTDLHLGLQLDNPENEVQHQDSFGVEAALSYFVLRQICLDEDVVNRADAAVHRLGQQPFQRADGIAQIAACGHEVPPPPVLAPAAGRPAKNKPAAGGSHPSRKDEA
ncbi:carbamoyl-phosphate synthase large chain [Mycolicibacterium canariasense]|uniref:Carbamoyl-phosphate synthase large chain n=1 Tax=Mycolicibacterium canariasense TaxID=228230 RepID=A0A117IC43_MYCCR|nr:hypothetical protein [Mycolicibacterium canariasense]MCV7210210.1 hypothetical protein [Mycolicibacterium canariasense]GAS98870.1 carbamoyl-phosphate synthase large chain [Mycolicibacterium canariasense]